MNAKSNKDGLIRPVVFTLNPESDLWSTSLYLLYLPDEWLGPLHELQAQKNDREGQPNSIELRALNSAVRTLFPQIYSTLPYLPALPDMFRRDQGEGQRPWLLASSPIDLDSLWCIFRAWLMVTYQFCPGFRAVYDKLEQNALKWESVNMGMAQGTNANGTANLHRDAYKILPTLIAHRLAGIPPSMRSMDGTSYSFDSGPTELEDCGLELEVYRAPSYLLRVPSTEGAELVSWPPSQYKTRDGYIPYSYMVKVSAQTVAGNPEPRIHMHYGVRRWVYNLLNDKGVLIMKNRNYSVFLRGTSPWSGQGLSNAFTIARMRPVWDGVSKRTPGWTDQVPDILEIAQAGYADAFRLPSPDELVGHPTDWLRPGGVDGVQAAITYAVTPLGHAVKQGLSLDVHERLTKSIEEHMSPRLTLVPPVDRLKPIVSARNGVNPLRMRLREIDAQTRLEGLADSVSASPTIEIYWQNPDVRDYLVTQIERLLKWPEKQIEKSPANDSEETTELISEATLPPEARRGVLLPGLDSSELALLVNDKVRNISGDTQGGSDTVLEDAEEDPELEYLSRELAGQEDATIEVEAVYEIATGKPERVNKLPKPKKAGDPPPGTAPEITEIDLAGQGTLRVVTIPLPQSSIADGLKNESKRRKDRIKATNARAAEITAYLKEHRPLEPEAVVLALVELPDYSSRAMRDSRPRDPKQAIRIGMMGAGRVTQFIAPRSKDPKLDPKKTLAELEQRAEMAVRDGLRQLGYMPSGIGLQPQKARYALPEDLLVAAVWLLRLTHKTAQQPIYMPVVVMMRTSERKVWAWLPDGKGMRTYRQAQLDMYEIDKEKVSRKMAPHNLAALRNFVLNELLQLGDDVLVLASAQNARSLWYALANGSVQFDHLHFDRNDTPQPVVALPGRLRVLRMRTSERGETPEYYWDGCAAGESKTGIWPADVDNRLYFSIGDKPLSMKNSRDSKEQNPSVYYAIPSILEIVPLALQPDDVAEAWVDAVHKWRKMGYVTNDNTLMPLPMVLAQRMDTYAQAIGPRVLQTEWEKIPDEEDDEDDGPGEFMQLSMF